MEDGEVDCKRRFALLQIGGAHERLQSNRRLEAS